MQNREKINEEEKQRRRQFANMLIQVGRLFNDSPDFTDAEKLRCWCLYLWPYAENVIPILADLPLHFSRWPSVADILKVANCAPKKSTEIIREAVNSIWVYLTATGDLTPLGGRVFDSLGGWEKLGQIQMDSYTRNTYNSIFYDRAKKLLAESQDNALPQLPAPEPTPDVLSDIEKMRAILDAKCTETHKMIYNDPIHPLHVDDPYEVRKQKAIEAGKKYWDPPRCWEIDEQRVKKPTQEDHRLWKEKIRRELFTVPAMQGSVRSYENRGDCCSS